jgi:hypothetical protein
MKQLLLIALLGLTACATQPRILVPAPALREVFRGGQIQGLEDNSGQYIGAPGSYDQIEHTCTSYPAYDLNGRYIKTIVKCW